MIASIERSSQPPLKMSSSLTFMVCTDFQDLPYCEPAAWTLSSAAFLSRDTVAPRLIDAHGMCLKAVSIPTSRTADQFGKRNVEAPVDHLQTGQVT